jgi:hypothetical protein
VTAVLGLGASGPFDPEFENKACSSIDDIHIGLARRDGPTGPFDRESIVDVHGN